jgi:membrane protein implicated in regulation of membrane protease activity
MRTGGALLAMWVVKDVALYPLLRRGYEVGSAHGSARLVGCTGVARQRLAPRGYVTVGGELWRAELDDGVAAIAAGASVRVVGARRLTLVVVPAEDRRGAVRARDPVAER